MAATAPKGIRNSVMDLPVIPDSAQTQPADAPPDIHGLADKAGPASILGWALDGARPGHRLNLELQLGREVIGTGVADQPRADLEANGIGDGRHGFEIAVLPALLQRIGDMRLFGLAADGTKVRVPMRMRRPPPPPPAPVAPPGMTLEEGERLKAELAALAQRLNDLPAAKALHQALAQQTALASQVHGMGAALDQRLAAALDQRLAAVASRDQVAQAVSAQEALQGRQDAAADRIVTLENWIARLERRVEDIPTGAPTTSAPPAMVDIWQKVLFAVLVGALAGALGVGVVLRLM
jgi:hypothetical protein